MLGLLTMLNSLLFESVGIDFKLTVDHMQVIVFLIIYFINDRYLKPKKHIEEKQEGLIHLQSDLFESS